MTFPSDPVQTHAVHPQNEGGALSINRVTLTWLWQMIRPFSWRLLVLTWVPLAWALGLSLTSYSIQMMVTRISQYQASLLGPLAFFIMIRVVLIGNYRFYEQIINIRMMPALRKRIGLEVTNQIFKKQYPYFQAHQSGALGAKINDLMRNIPNLLEIITQDFLGNTLAVIIAIVMLTTIQPIFGGLMAFWAICVVGISWVASKRLLIISHDFFKKWTVLTGKIIDTLGNILSVRLFYTMRTEDRVLSEEMNDLIGQEKFMEQKYFQMRSLTSIISVGVFLANGYFLCQGYANGTIDAGGLVLVLGVNRSVMDFLWKFDQVFSNISEYYGSISQSLQTVFEGKSMDDDKNLPDLYLKKGGVTFTDVNFSYPGCPSVFKNLSLNILPGEKVGVVGRSGSGKSTFAHLLLRLYDIQGGTISIDGQNIAQTNSSSLYNQVTLVPQETSLFERSLKDNVWYANPSASIADLELALGRSCCDTFIRDLPNGMDTFIGEHGVRLSGGQKQRISMARAMLRHGKILILDESTSQLDSVTESQLQENLWQFFADKTVIVIAHRLATLRRMDRIIVFDGGQISEQGSHDELLAQQGLYHRMWETQER